MKSLDASQFISIPNLADYISRVEHELDRVLEEANPHIRRPLTRLMHAHSKRLRPTLVLAIPLSQGLKIDKRIVRVCVALELIHIGSLVHDDIIDQSDTRWRVPTINSQEGINQALVVGNYLFAKAFERASLVSLDISKLVGQTLAALADGESRESAERFNTDRTLKSMRIAHQGKTAALFAMSSQASGIAAGLTCQKIDALNHFGVNFGMAFQLLDDVLDLLSTQELSGKPVGKDVEEGVYTMPLILSMSGAAGADLKSLLDGGKPIPNQELVDKLKADGSLQKSIQKIWSYNYSAAQALGVFRPSVLMDELKELPSKYTRAALRHYTAAEHQEYINQILEQ